MDWAEIKEWCGFLGALCAAAPWIRDFRYRVAAERRKSIQANGSIDQWIKAVQAADQSWLAKPKAIDLLLTIGGLFLVAASFLIAILTE